MIHYYLTFFTRLRLPISISQHSGWLTVLEPFGSSSSLFNCAGVLKRSCGPFLPEPWIQKARKKSNSSSYWFLSLGAVVDWNYSYLRYSYFLINCAGAGLRNRDCVYRFLSCSLYCPISVAEDWDAGAVFSDAVDIHLAWANHEVDVDVWAVEPGCFEFFFCEFCATFYAGCIGCPDGQVVRGCLLYTSPSPRD